MDPSMVQEFETKLQNWIGQATRSLPTTSTANFVSPPTSSRSGRQGERAGAGVLAHDPRDRGDARVQRHHHFPRSRRPASLGRTAPG